jgi:amidophosphoribosyltransferase
MAIKSWNEMRKLDISKYVKKRDGADYLPWAECLKLLYENGAQEVHVRPACPPILFGCKYLNFSRSRSEMELIARRVIEELEGGPATREVVQEYADPNSEKYQRMVDRICEKLNFTSLRYHRLDDMLESVGIDRESLCTYCWDGRE